MCTFDIAVSGLFSSKPVLNFIEKHEKKHQLEYLSDNTLEHFTEDYVRIMLVPLEYLISRDLVFPLKRVHVHIDDPGKDGYYTAIINLDPKGYSHDPVILCYHGKFSVNDKPHEWLEMFGFFPAKTGIQPKAGLKLQLHTAAAPGMHTMNKYYNPTEIHRIAYAVSDREYNYPIKQDHPHPGLVVYSFQIESEPLLILASPPVSYIQFENYYLNAAIQTRTGKYLMRMFYENSVFDSYAVMVPPRLRSRSLTEAIRAFKSF